MYGKIINEKLAFAGKKIQIENGWITNPTVEQLIANGYKEVIYSQVPEYDDEEEKLIEVYIETDIITVNYEKITLTDEEHNNIIKQKIIEEENEITKRNILDFLVDNDMEAKNRIQQHRDIIIALRAKLR